MPIIGETLRVQFITVDPLDGSAVNADALPTGILRRNGSTVGGASVSVSNLGTGRYLAEVLVDGAHGWVVGDSFALEISSTVAGVSGLVNTIAQGFIRDDVVANIDALLDAIKGAGWSTETLKAIYDAVLTRLADADYVLPDNATIGIIDGKVDLIGTDTTAIIAQLTAIAGAGWTTETLVALYTAVAAIKAKTDQMTITMGDVVVTLNGEEVNLDIPGLAEIDALLTANHGAGKWGAPGAASGQYTFTVTITSDESGTPAVPGALVTIQDLADNIIQWGETDLSGQIVFTLDADDYLVAISAGVKYSPFTPASKTIAGNDTGAYQLSVQSPTPPASPSLCTVYAYQYLNGVPVKNRVVKALLQDLPQKLPSIVLEKGPVEVRTNALGYWSMDLVRGKNYKFTVPEAGLSTEIAVPDAATYDITDSLN